MKAQVFVSTFSVLKDDEQYPVKINLHGYKSAPQSGNLQGSLLCTGLTCWYFVLVFEIL